MEMVQDSPGAQLLPVLQAVSRELASLGDMGSSLQSVLSSLASAHARMTGDSHVPGSEDIQALDLFTQRLFVLADFLTALAPTVTPGSCGNLDQALEVVSLSDVARRLKGESPHDMEVDAGEFEMFGDDP